MKKIITLAIMLTVSAVFVIIVVVSGQQEAFGGPKLTYQKSILPVVDSEYFVGTSTNAWLQMTSDEMCLTGDSCITSWGGGGGGGNTDYLGSIGDVSTTTLDTGYTLAYTANDEWQSTSSLIVNTEGLVGVATTSPLYTLDVFGDIRADDDIYLEDKLEHVGDTNTYLDFNADEQLFISGGLKMLRLFEGTTDQVVVNEDSADINFRVETDGDANTLFVNGGNDRVGIRTDDPGATLDVRGTMDVRETNSQFDIIETDTGKNWRLEVSNSNFVFTETGALERLFLGAGGNVGFNTVTPNFKWETIGTNANGYFGVSSAVGNDGDIFVIDNNGDVGIGTTTPGAKLAVEGDVLADAYLTFSPDFQGSALLDLVKIDCEAGTKKADGWCKVDHGTLPSEVRNLKEFTYKKIVGTTTKDIKIKDLRIGTTTEGVEKIMKKVVPVYEEVTQTNDLMDIGKLVMFIKKAVKELYEIVVSLTERVESNESKIIELENKIKQLEKSRTLIN